MTEALKTTLSDVASAQKMPEVETYEKELKFMPWGALIQEVQEKLVQALPQEGKVLDLLCGPGQLMGALLQQRPDLRVTAVDISKEYIARAQRAYPTGHFVEADVLQWQSDDSYDAVVCTGGLHHLPYEHQEALVEKMAALVSEKGHAILADPLIENYTNEQQRMTAAAQLGHEYLRVTIEAGAPPDVVKAAVQILENDVLGTEFKTSLAKLEPVFRKYFPHVEIHKKWPSTDSAYGDYYFILRKNI